MAERITILAGHYGSGKTNIAVNLAISMKRAGKKVSVCDLDIVNPYFRTKDSEDDFRREGIPLISSDFANSNVDVPALPQSMYAVVDDRSTHFVLDVGGDDRGALALGRLSPRILEEGSFAQFLVVNFYRPLTQDSSSMAEVMREIEKAAGIPFTGIINNSNLGEETTKEDVFATLDRAASFAEAVGLPLVMTTVKDSLFDSCKEKIPNLFP